MKKYGKYEGARHGAIPRRKFLMLTSAAIATAVATDLPAQIVRTAFGFDEELYPLLSVGHSTGSLPELQSATAGLVGADALRAGDRSLIRSGVRIEVQSFQRAASRAEVPISIGLNALYRVSGHAETARVPFLAWSWASSMSNPSSRPARPFVVPVDSEFPLELIVTTRAPHAGRSALRHDERLMTESKERSIISLSVGAGRRSMKLRRGIYFLALRSSESERRPNWRSIRVENVGGQVVLTQPTLAGYEPVSFDYVMLSVDKA